MTPAARLQTAMELTDRIAAGEAAEKVLTSWGRRARFAGSKDRAAVRDHVFDVLRRWRSTAAMGGGDTGRARVLGLVRQHGIDPDTVFSGAPHAPAPLTAAERAAGHLPSGAEAWDLPDWIAARFADDLGAGAAANAEALRHRADVDLRVNTLRTDRARAQARLAEEGIATVPQPLAKTALRVTSGARAVARSGAYLDGWVELQDAASQAVVAELPAHSGPRVLDYCAGGGGKTLALAAHLPDAQITAHDAEPKRMGDLGPRALRAGVSERVRTVDKPRGAYDLVLADAPCSGSGSWRRAPEGKWRLTPERLTHLAATQREILSGCAALTAPGGLLCYVTCSVLSVENDAQIAAFLADRPGWTRGTQRQFLPTDGGDGFFVSLLQSPDVT